MGIRSGGKRKKKKQVSIPIVARPPFFHTTGVRADMAALETGTEDGPQLTDEAGTVAAGGEDKWNFGAAGGETVENAVRSVLAAHPGLLPVNDYAPRPVNTVQHHIELEEGTQPYYQAPLRLPHADQTEMKLILDELLGGDVIEPSVSQWGAPAFLVGKTTGGKKRLVVDFRELNKRTVVPRMPMPVARDAYDALSGCSVFSVVDLRAGFFGVMLDEDSRDCTTFTTRHGTFRWKRMAMGLAGAPSTYTRFIQQALGDVLYNGAIAYLDDVLIYAKTPGEHARILRLVLERLDAAGAVLSINKCVFGSDDVVFLGHRVTAGGLRKEARKVEYVRAMEAPKTVDELRSQLAFMQYYSDFVENFAVRANPLFKLLRDGSDWVWGAEQELAFLDLKSALAEEAVLQYPDYD